MKTNAMLIKVCGMRDAENIAAVARLDPAPDMMGFIFYGRSPRNACAMPTEALDALSAAIRRVGVFVDASREEVLETARRYELDFVQLHGGESPEMCAALRSHGLGVMKAFGIATADDLARTAEYEGSCDLYVFDTRLPGSPHGGVHGGSGVKFDHSVLAYHNTNTPYLLSGGLAPGDAGQLATTRLPLCAGFDINSRFETSPGIKDPEAINNFITKIKSQRQ